MTQSRAAKANGFLWMDADAYLFDIDGTLLNTTDLVHYNALNCAMREVYGADTTIDGIAFHGKTDPGILRAALERAGITPAAFEEKLPQALELVRREVAQNVHGLAANVCASIPAVLARLQAAGKLLGVASGNLESVGWQKIAAAGLREFLSFGCFSDQCETRAELFAEAVAEVHRRLGAGATVCFVGDTPDDIRAARAVGARIIAVSTGTYKLEDLLPLGPDLCIGSCGELLMDVAETSL